MTKSKKILSILLLKAGAIAAAFLIGGCVTTSEVKSIVANSNAAMISPPLDLAGSNETETWQSAVEQIDKLIAENSSEPILVNHLHLRAAMLLTVNQQDSLANLRWREVEGSQLQSERDKTLFECKDALVWTYARFKDPTPFDSAEHTMADARVTILSESLLGVQTYDTKIFLGTIRAQLQLKRANDSKNNTPEQTVAIKTLLATGLNDYYSLFSKDDTDWVASNQTIPALPGTLKLGVFKNRIWLLELIAAYKDAASEFGVSPDWNPNILNT